MMGKNNKNSSIPSTMEDVDPGANRSPTEDGSEVYHDYANETEAESRANLPESSSSSNTEQNFPSKLHYMLADMEEDGLDYIVAWQSHGRAFMVHKQDEFVSRILPL